MFFDQSFGCKEGFNRHGFHGRHRGGHGFGGGFQAMQQFMSARRAPVDVEENNEQFTIHLYAAGLQKEAIRIRVKNDELSISYQGTEHGNDSRDYAHREFHNRGFERKFALNGKVLTDKIEAAYQDGILKVVLPKNPETNIPAQEISVG